MPIDENTLVDALGRLKRAARSLRRADVARRAVAKIEAASTDRYLMVDVAVDVALTTAESTLDGSLLAEAKLVLIGGEVALLRTWREGQDLVVFWLDLEHTVRDGVAHALPALADAVAVAMLARSSSLKLDAIGAKRRERWPDA